MVNYQLGKIYKIVCNITGKVYVGSTCKSLEERLCRHSHDYKCWLQGKFHKLTSFDIIQNGDFSIVLIESYPCNNKDELYARERHFANQFDCVNRIKNVGLRNEIGEKAYKKHYRETNKQQISEKAKEFYKEHKEEYRKRSKVYRDSHKDEKQQQNKQYRLTHELKIKEMQKLYRETHRHELRAKQNIKHICACGGQYTTSNKAIHSKGKRHLQYVEDLQKNSN